jgi:tRNA A-37 threonylcarbamoyl transferase component Bud32
MHSQDVSPELRRRDEAVIRRELGPLRDDEIAYADEGWDSRVYLVDRGRVVFKFPRSDLIRARFALEVAALRMLERARTSVVTPRVRYEDPDLEYFGYAGVVGRPLSEAMAALTRDEKTAIGTEVGSFLRVLHAADLDGVPTMTVAAEASNYAERFAAARPALAAALTPEELHVVESFILDQLPHRMIGLGGDLRLSHADLGPWNMVLSTAGDVGVIDFGDISYYDASKDFSGFGDEVILQAAFAAYGADDLLRAKAALRIKAFPVLDFPFCLGKQDQAGIDACVQLVRRVTVRDGADAASPPGEAREPCDGADAASPRAKSRALSVGTPCVCGQLLAGCASARQTRAP